MPPGKKGKPQFFVSPSENFSINAQSKLPLGMSIYLWAPETVLSKSAWTPASFFFFCIILLKWWPVWLIYIPGVCLLQIPNRQSAFVSIFQIHLVSYLFWKMLSWNNSPLYKVPSSRSGPRTAEAQK